MCVDDNALPIQIRTVIVKIRRRRRRRRRRWDPFVGHYQALDSRPGYFDQNR